MTDQQRVRDYLAAWSDASWSKPDDDAYVGRVVTEIQRLRLAYPDGDLPTRTHGIDDIGACVACDAIAVLMRDYS